MKRSSHLKLFPLITLKQRINCKITFNLKFKKKLTQKHSFKNVNQLHQFLTNLRSKSTRNLNSFVNHRKTQIKINLKKFYSLKTSCLDSKNLYLCHPKDSLEKSSLKIYFPKISTPFPPLARVAKIKGLVLITPLLGIVQNLQPRFNK